MVAEKQKAYLGALAQLIRSRWESRIGPPLDVRTERIMPDPNGGTYLADIVLQRPADHLPLVVFELRIPGTPRAETEKALRRILDSREAVELLGGKKPTVVLIVARGHEEEGREIIASVGDQIELEAA
jgi:hypothetical protein